VSFYPRNRRKSPRPSSSTGPASNQGHLLDQNIGLVRRLESIKVPKKEEGMFKRWVAGTRVHQWYLTDRVAYYVGLYSYRAHLKKKINNAT
jgi:hypothetical protein